MNVHDLNRNDSIVCQVKGHNREGCFLSIIGLDEKPIVRIFDLCLPTGSVVLASIRKMSTDRRYLKVSLDSIIYSNDNDFAA